MHSRVLLLMNHKSAVFEQRYEIVGTLRYEVERGIFRARGTLPEQDVADIVNSRNYGKTVYSNCELIHMFFLVRKIVLLVY